MDNQASTLGNQSNQQTQNSSATITSTLPQCYPENISSYIRKDMRHDMTSFIGSASVKTGYQNLDAVIKNMYPGFYVLGAASSLGKTTFALQMADQFTLDAEQVIYFTMEQSRLELVSKSLSRMSVLKCRTNPSLARTAIQIRKGDAPQAVKDAFRDYKNDIADYLTIIEGDFTTDMNAINRKVEDFVKTTGQVPIIIVDYLQIVQEDLPTDKGKVDYITKGLKMLQRKYNTIVIAISSINRGNYMLPIDFESFKESGSIEYSADVVWGLQLQIMNDPTFASAKNVTQRRKVIAAAKAASPRKVELVCLKNRFGIASYSCGFLYYPQYDLFTTDPNYKSQIPTCPVPKLIV
ncbi:MAG: hypothetical protein K5989_10705 [Lachnospiraceae bacterium]|nr:hypothetical protein [Lachnospiraceae bacterium]